MIEEHEQRAEIGQAFGSEVVSRQFVDGLSIDEHLQMAIYDEAGNAIVEERYFHQNARNDTVAVSDASGEVLHLLEYTTYGIAFSISDSGELEEFRLLILMRSCISSMGVE